MQTNENAKVSRHKCLVYDGHPSEQLSVVVPLLLDGLETRNRCLYLGPPDMVDMVRSALAAKGVDTKREVDRTALLLSSDRSHLKDGNFDPDAMVAGLTELVNQAVKDGFAGLCATGDMRWELGEDRNFERLLEYEAKLERVFEHLPLRGICQYHRESVPRKAVRDALLTHQAVYAGSDLNSDNLFYIPPDLLLGKSDPATRDKQGEWMYRQISRIAQAERERDRALNALQELNADLESQVLERTAELETFSYSVSHDLRAPLRAIDGFTKRILDRMQGAMDSESKMDFNRVTDAAERMAKLIEGLFELSQAGRGKLESEEVDLSKLAAAILTELKSADPGRVILPSVEPGLTAKGDPRLLSAALANLLSNAWKFTSKAADGRIQFGVMKKDGRRVFYVRDNGAGFDPASSKKLFQPFERLHARSEFPGSGVGLATTARIFRRHGGQLWAEAAVGKGATFYFTLPG